MRRMRGIGEDALTRMKRVSAAVRQRFVRLAAGTRLRFLGVQFDEWKIVDRARPGEHGVV